MEMDDKLKYILRQLEDVMEQYYSAKVEHDKAFDEYDGYSWDYYGSDYVLNMQDAKDKFRQLFMEAVSYVADK